MITFEITEYEDNTYRIETKHIAYHYRDNLLYDNLTPETIFKAMQEIEYEMRCHYGEAVNFVIN